MTATRDDAPAAEVDPDVRWPSELPPALLRALAAGFGEEPDGPACLARRRREGHVYRLSADHPRIVPEGEDAGLRCVFGRGKGMSVINNLLAQSLNHILWVILGLAAWIGCYWQLYSMGSEKIADVVTLVLAVLPLGIAFVSFNVVAARWSGKRSEAVVFLVLGVASLIYAGTLYFRESKVRQVFKDRAILRGPNPQVTASLIIRVLLGAISVLASVTLLIWGGWELIRGSVTVGLILAPIGAVMLLLDRGPDWHYKNWCINVFKLTYSALMEGTAAPKSQAAPAA